MKVVISARSCMAHRKLYTNFNYMTINKGRQSLIMCEVQSWNTCMAFNKEIKIGPIYERCGRLILLRSPKFNHGWCINFKFPVFTFRVLRWDWTLISKCWFNPLECTYGSVILHIYRTLPYCVTERDLIPYTHYFLIRSPVQIWLNLVYTHFLFLFFS